MLLRLLSRRLYGSVRRKLTMHITVLHFILWMHLCWSTIMCVMMICYIFVIKCYLSIKQWRDDSENCFPNAPEKMLISLVQNVGDDTNFPFQNKYKNTMEIILIFLKSKLWIIVFILSANVSWKCFCSLRKKQRLNEKKIEFLVLWSIEWVL